MSLLVSVSLAILFLAATFGFGFMIARHVLRVDTTIAATGLGIAIGNAAYLTVSNALGFLLPIHASFRLTLVLLAVAGVWVFLRRNNEPHPWEKPPRSVWIVLGTVIMLAGLAFARDQGSDAWLMIHFPLPATILQGNFPVMDPVNPWNPFAYHYGPGLMAAAFSSITGLSIAVGYAIQPLLNAAMIVLIATGLAWELCRSWKASATAGLLAFAGSGLYWLYVLPLGRDVWDAYVLGQPMIPAGETPFRWLAYAIRNLVTSPPMMMLGHRPIGMGFAYFYGLLFAFHGMMKEPDRIVRWAAVSVVFGAALAHTMETTLVVLLGAMAVFFGVLLLARAPIRKALGLPLFVFAIAVTIIALVQGGVLSTLLFRDGPPSFALLFDGYLHLGGEKNLSMLPLWGWEFALIFGVPLALFPVVVWYVVRRKGVTSFHAFLCMLAAMHFALPLFVHFLPRPHEMKRFFYVFMSLSAFLIGLLLHETWLSSRSRRLRIAASACIGAMLFAAALHLPMRLLFPTLRLEQAPLFPGMPPATEEQMRMFTWVADNTAETDYFLMALFAADQDRLRPPVTFAAHTGRFVIQASAADAEPARVVGLMNDIEERCDAAAFAALHIRYVVIETAEDEAWFLGHCDKALWTQRFPAMEMNGLPRIDEFLRWSPPGA